MSDWENPYTPPRRNRPLWKNLPPPEDDAGADPGAAGQGRDDANAGAPPVNAAHVAILTAPDVPANLPTSLPLTTPAPAETEDEGGELPPVRVARVRRASRPVHEEADALAEMADDVLPARPVRAARAAQPAQQPLPDGVVVQRVPMAARAALRRRADPTFGLLICFAINLGLAPIAPENGDLRLTVAWGLLALFAIGGWGALRAEKTRLDNLVLGGVFGLIMALPLLVFGGGALVTTARLLFRADIGGLVQTLPQGAVLAYLIFVMPLAETLFFRGVMQNGRSFLQVGVAASVWSILLFFPMLEIGRYGGVAFLIGLALVLINMLYSYVRRQNGLAAAWVCQIVVNLILLFLPYLGVGG